MGDHMGYGGPPPDAGAPEPAEDKDPQTIFLSKEALGGRTVKKGDTLNLTVAEVDPETGDVEASIATGGGEGGMGGEDGNEAAFDKAVPAEDEGGY
jgi:hypothetical protein